jgi:hypothetical protein
MDRTYLLSSPDVSVRALIERQRYLTNSASPAERFRTLRVVAMLEECLRTVP